MMKHVKRFFKCERLGEEEGTNDTQFRQANIVWVEDGAIELEGGISIYLHNNVRLWIRMKQNNWKVIAFLI